MANYSTYEIILFIILLPFEIIFSIVYLLIYPFIWCCCKSRRRPRAKNVKPKVTTSLTFKSELTSWFKCCSYLYHRCCCSFKFLLSVQNAIKRYEEQPPEPFEVFINNLQHDWKINILLNTLNTRTPKFFFKILPSGSIRERFGKALPSRSILASDYDLMLVPDGVLVRDASRDEVAVQMTNTGQPNTFPAIFEAVADPNTNPETPNGYLWLRLLEHDLKHWNNLCYQRLTKDGVESYLSQLAVYNQIKTAIIDDPTVKLMFSLYGILNVKAEIERNGPALTVKLYENGTDKKGGCFGGKSKDERELLHIDFTFAIHCPKFPREAEGFFQKRNSVADNNPIYWPPLEIVQKIRTVGCHVVPKPSTKELVFYTPEQREHSYLSQGAALEWRYSFSQAEMILSDHIPKQARTAFLAFKAVIKMRINNQPDMWGKFHEVPSYVLKTILFYEVENKPPAYWIDGVEEEFLNRLLDVLIGCIGERMCKMYWIENINLLADKNDSDIQFITDKLQRIKRKLSRYLTDDWIECQRLLRLNCLKCFKSSPLSETITIEKDVQKWACCNIPCSYGESTCCCGPLDVDIVRFDVY